MSDTRGLQVSDTSKVIPEGVGVGVFFCVHKH